MKKVFATNKAGKVFAIFATTTILAMPIFSASGASVTYNGTVTPSTLGNNVATDLSMFDTSMGTLTGVQVTLDFTLTPYLQIVNNTGSTRTFTSSDSGFHSYSPSDILTITYGSDSWTLAAPTVTTGTITGTGQVLSPFSTMTFVGSTSAPADLTSASGLDFSAYEGSGDLIFFGTGGPGFSSGTGPFFNVVSGLGGYVGGGADLDGTASVTYTFTPAPEPSTLALLGLCGLVVVLLRKQQQSKASARSI